MHLRKRRRPARIPSIGTDIDSQELSRTTDNKVLPGSPERDKRRFKLTFSVSLELDNYAFLPVERKACSFFQAFEAAFNGAEVS